MLSEFESLPAADPSKVISGMLSKSCELDALPTAILTICLDILIFHIVNLSLSSGIFPDQFKHTCIKPVVLNLFPFMAYFLLHKSSCGPLTFYPS